MWHNLGLVVGGWEGWWALFQCALESGAEVLTSCLDPDRTVKSPWLTHFPDAWADAFGPRLKKPVLIRRNMASRKSDTVLMGGLAGVGIARSGGKKFRGALHMGHHGTMDLLKGETSVRVCE